MGQFPRVQALVPTEEAPGFTGGANEFRRAHLAVDMHDRFVAVGAVWRDAHRDDFAHVFQRPAFLLGANGVRICCCVHAHHHVVIHGQAPPAVRGRSPSSSRVHVSSEPMHPSGCTTLGSMAMVPPSGIGRSNPFATTGASSS